MECSQLNSVQTEFNNMQNGNKNCSVCENSTETNTKYTYDSLVETARYLLDRTKIRPKIGIICGSGMGSLAEDVTDCTVFPYDTIPNFPVSTVEGHKGQLVFGRISGIEVVCMQGRFHYYEGYPLWKCAMPVRVMKLVGVTHLIATNAAGGLNHKYKVGDIMLLRDHINLMGFAGNNPLQGPNDERFGPRFPLMNKAYDITLLKEAQRLWVSEGLGADRIHEGIYTCLGGPNFETVAELRMLRMLGVDAVGMSTVHEVITARHCDMTAIAFSLITNTCPTDYDHDGNANHDEIMDVDFVPIHGRHNIHFYINSYSPRLFSTGREQHVTVASQRPRRWR